MRDCFVLSLSATGSEVFQHGNNRAQVSQSVILFDETGSTMLDTIKMVNTFLQCTGPHHRSSHCNQGQSKLVMHSFSLLGKRLFSPIKPACLHNHATGVWNPLSIHWDLDVDIKTAGQWLQIHCKISCFFTQNKPISLLSMTECILIKGCKQSLSVQSPSLMLVSWRVKSADRTDHLKTPARPGWMTSNKVRGSSLLTSVSGCITTFPQSFARGTKHILQLSIMSWKTTQKTQDL